MYRIIILLLFTVTMPVFASRTVVTQTPAYKSCYAPQAYYGGDYIPDRRYYQRKHSSLFPDINELERYALNKNFTKDSDRTRLERLETLAFGAVQEGDIYTRYDNVRNFILSKQKQNYKTSLIQSLSSYFNGQLTGFTPSLTNNSYFGNYNQYSSGYNNSSQYDYNSPFGKSHKTNYYETGNNFGVHILD